MYVLSEPIQKLARKWKQDSADMRARFGDSNISHTLSTLAAELSQAIEQARGRLFGLREAAEVSGYSADHLGRLVRQEKIPNAGRPNAPKIALRDLPMKPGHLHSGGGFDEFTEARADRIARSVVSPEKEASDG